VQVLHLRRHSIKPPPGIWVSNRAEVRVTPRLPLPLFLLALAEVLPLSSQSSCSLLLFKGFFGQRLRLRHGFNRAEPAHDADKVGLVPPFRDG